MRHCDTIPCCARSTIFSVGVRTCMIRCRHNFSLGWNGRLKYEQQWKFKILVVVDGNSAFVAHALAPGNACLIALRMPSQAWLTGCLSSWRPTAWLSSRSRIGKSTGKSGKVATQMTTPAHACSVVHDVMIYTRSDRRTRHEELIPMKHYIPVKHDLSDLGDVLRASSSSVQGSCVHMQFQVRLVP